MEVDYKNPITNHILENENYNIFALVHTKNEIVLLIDIIIFLLLQ